MRAFILTVFILGSFSSAYGTDQVYEMTCQRHNEHLGGYQEEAIVIRQPVPGKHEQYKDLFTFIFGGVYKSPELDLHIYRFKTKDTIDFNKPEKMAQKLMKTVTPETPIAKGKAQRKSMDVFFEGHVEGERGLQEFMTRLTSKGMDSLAMYHSPRFDGSFHCSEAYLVNYEAKNNNNGSPILDSDQAASLNDDSSALD